VEDRKHTGLKVTCRYRSVAQLLLTRAALRRASRIYLLESWFKVTVVTFWLAVEETLKLFSSIITTKCTTLYQIYWMRAKRNINLFCN
jgi:hypothetical protein